MTAPVTASRAAGITILFRLAQGAGVFTGRTMILTTAIGRRRGRRRGLIASTILIRPAASRGVGVGKFCLFRRGVCSEQTAKFMVGAGFMNVTYGLTPDNLADLWRESKSMNIVFEGVWE